MRRRLIWWGYWLIQWMSVLLYQMMFRHVWMVQTIGMPLDYACFMMMVYLITKLIPLLMTLNWLKPYQAVYPYYLIHHGNTKVFMSYFVMKATYISVWMMIPGWLVSRESLDVIVHGSLTQLMMIIIVMILDFTFRNRSSFKVILIASVVLFHFLALVVPVNMMHSIAFNHSIQWIDTVVLFGLCVVVFWFNHLTNQIKWEQ